LIDFRQHWQVRTNDYPDWVIVVVLRTCQNNREIIRLTWGLVFAFVQMDYYNATMAHPFAWTYTGKPVQKQRRASFVAPHRRLKLEKSQRLANTATS